MQVTKMLALLITGTIEVYGERRVVVSLQDRKLALLDNDKLVRTYDVAVGKPSSPTPSGTFEIVSHIANPTWFGPSGQVVGPGKNNPVGTRWMGLSKKGFGIHGTNRPSSIGKRASHGCIRMKNSDAEDLFTRVGVGDTVELLAEVPQGMKSYFEPAPVTPANPETPVVAASDAAGAVAGAISSRPVVGEAPASAQSAAGFARTATLETPRRLSAPDHSAIFSDGYAKTCTTARCGETRQESPAIATTTPTTSSIHAGGF